MALLQAGLFAGLGGEHERAAMLFGAGDHHFAMQKAPFYSRQLEPLVRQTERGSSKWIDLTGRF